MKKERAGSRDVVLVHGVTDDGKGLAVLRAREDRLEAGQVRPLHDGEPIHGDVVKLRPRPECPLVCDVTVEHPAPARAETECEVHRATTAPEGRTGPAQVATPRYRANWDAVFGGGARKAALN